MVRINVDNVYTTTVGLKDGKMGEREAVGFRDAPHLKTYFSLDRKAISKYLSFFGGRALLDTSITLLTRSSIL